MPGRKTTQQEIRVSEVGNLKRRTAVTLSWVPSSNLYWRLQMDFCSLMDIFYSKEE